MRAKAKRQLEVPPSIKAFIDAVFLANAENLKAVLDAFVWSYDKGDFNHWVPLINHFDQWLEEHVAPRLELDLSFPESPPTASPFPTDVLLSILRVTTLILENCSNKHMYNSYEHLARLLAAPEPEVVLAALECLAAFARKTSASNLRWQGDTALNSRLLAMTQAWGGTGQDLDMVTCVSEKKSLPANHKACALHFELKQQQDRGAALRKGQDSRSRVINIPDLGKVAESPHEILKELVARFTVPEEQRFTLLSQIRRAKGFATLEGRRYLLTVRLLAFYVYFQSNPVPEDISAFFVSEPEFVSELTSMLPTSAGVPEKLRYRVLRALAVQLLDRSRHSVVIGALGSGGQAGLLSTMMQKAVGSLLAPSTAAEGERSEPLTEGGFSLQTTEALLSLISFLVASSSGCNALAEAAMLPTLLPLLEDHNSAHLSIVCNTVRIMEAFLDFSPSAASTFRDLGGLQAMIRRLKVEVQIDHANESPEDKDIAIPYQRRVLLKALLRTMALASYAPTSGTATRPEDADCHELFPCLKTMISNAKDFGGGLFALAASVMTDLIHHDPLCYPILDDAGLPQAYLKAVDDGIIPSNEAVCNLPNCLVALCVTTRGLERVREFKALERFMPILTSRKYLKALQGESATVLGAGLDELMRHVPSLRRDGIEVVLQTLRRLCELGGHQPPPAAPLADDAADAAKPAAAGAAPGGSDMQPMEIDDSAPAAQESADSAMPAVVDDVPVETYLADCIANTARMLESLLSNADTNRVFIEKGGVDLLLLTYGLPKLPLAIGSSSVANHALLSIFRTFAPQHAASLSKSVRAALQTQLESTLAHLEPLQGQSFLQIAAPDRDRATQMISASEGLAALASAVVRSTNLAMLEEVSSGTVALLSTMCKVEQIVLQQLNLVEPEAQQQEASEQTAPADDTGAAPAPGMAASTGTPAGTVPDATAVGAAPVAEEPPPGAQADKKKKKSPQTVCCEVLTSAVATFRGLYSAIAKTVHSPTRRRDDTGVTNAMISAAAGLALVLKSNLVRLPGSGDDSVLSSVEEMGDATQGNRLVCRLREVGRIVEELSSVLFDARRNTCHCLVLNFFMHFNGISLVTRQFQHVVDMLWQCQQLRDQEGPSGKPGEAGTSGGQQETTAATAADKKAEAGRGTPWSNAEATVQAFLALFEQLTEAPLILNTPQSGALMSAKLPSGGAAEAALSNQEAADNAASMVRSLQVAVAAAVQPLWTHPNLAKAPPALVSSLVSVISNSTEGTAAAASRAASNAAIMNARNGAPLDADMVQQLVDMGFPTPRAEHALRQIGRNSVELALEWLVTHPEEPAAAGATPAPDAAMEETADDAAGGQTMFSALCTAFGKELLQDGKESIVQPPGATDEEAAEMPGIQELVDSAVALLSSNSLAYPPLCDMLVALCRKDDGKDRQAIISHLADGLEAASAGPKLAGGSSLDTQVFAAAQLLALLLTEDHACAKAANDLGLVSRILSLLEAWDVSFSGMDHATVVVPPSWIEALLLALAALAKTFFSPGQAGTAASGTAAPAAADAEEVPADTASAGHEEGAPAGNPAAAAAAAAAAAPPGLAPQFAELLKSWNQVGYLTDADQDRAIGACLRVLHHLHDRVADDWKPSEPSAPDASKSLVEPDPAATALATIQLLGCLTRRHPAALRVLNNGGLNLLLGLPRPCVSPQLEPHISSVLRHILEDPGTLQSAMEAEIRSNLASRSNTRPSLLGGMGGGGGATPPLRTFLSNMSHIISREPAVFLEAVNNTCSVAESSGGISNRYVVSLKSVESPPDKPATAAAPAAAASTAPAADTDHPSLAEVAPAQKDSPHTPGTKAPTNAATQKEAAKSGKKVVPTSFVDVVDCLVDVLLRYSGAEADLRSTFEKEASSADKGQKQDRAVSETPRAARARALSLAAVAATSEDFKPQDPVPPQARTPEEHKQLVQCMVLKMLTDFTLLYGSCIGVLLKRDADLGGWTSGPPAGPPSKPAAGSHSKSGSKHHQPTLGKEHPGCTGLLHHILHCHLVQAEHASWAGQGLLEHASYFLISACVRSVEARKRVVHDLVATLMTGLEEKPAASCSDPPGTPAEKIFPSSMKVYVELIGSLLAASSANKQPNPRHRAPSNGTLSTDMIRLMRESGMVPALTRAMNLVDLDHPQAPKSLNAILKPLEILTRPDPAAQVGGQRPAAAAASTAANAEPTAACAAPAGGATSDGGAATRENDDITNTQGPNLATPVHAADTNAGPDALRIVDRFIEADSRQAEEEAYGDAYGDHAMLADAMDDMMHGMDSDEEGSEEEEHSGSEMDHDDDEDGDEEEEEGEDSQGEGRIEGDDDLDEESVEGDDMEGSSGEEESEEEESDSDEDADADLIVDGEEEEMHAVEDLELPEEEDDEIEDEGPSDDEAYEMGMDAADLEGAWGSLRQGDPIRELEEAWDDDDDVFDNDGADGVPSWSGFGGHMLMGEADHLPAGMDDLVEELMQAHSGRGLDSVVIRDGGRRRRYRLVSNLPNGAEHVDRPPLSAAMAPQQHRLLLRSPHEPGSSYSRGGRYVDPNANLAVEPGLRWRQGVPGHAPADAFSHLRGGPLFVFGGRDQAVPSITARARDLALAAQHGPGGMPVALDLLADPGVYARGGAAGSEMGLTGNRRGSANMGHGVLSSLETLISGSAARREPSGRRPPGAPEAAPSAAVAAGAGPPGAEAAGMDSDGAPSTEAADGADGEEALAAQQQLRTEQLTLEDSVEEQPPARAAPCEGMARADGQQGEAGAPFAEALAASLAASIQAQSSQRDDAAPSPLIPAPSTAPVPPASAFSLPAPPEGALPRATTAPATSAPPGAHDAIQQGAVAAALQAAMASLPSDPAAPPPADAAQPPADGADDMDTDDVDTGAAAAEQSAQEPPADAPAQEAGDPSGGSGLPEATKRAAEAAGVDLAFLEALPPELQAEVLSQHGVSLPAPAPASAPASSERPGVVPASAAPAASAPPPGDAPAAGGSDDAPAGTPAAAPEGEGGGSDEDMSVDPEFLAALPPEIQEEVIAQQRMEQRRRRRQREAARQQREPAAAAASNAAAGDAAGAGGAAGPGADADMDMATVLATFPPDLREEVLLTSDEALLASLPPALMAEAQSLRERAMRSFGGGRAALPFSIPTGSRAGNIFGALDSFRSRGRQAHPTRRGEDGAAAAPSKAAVQEGPPQVDEDSIATLIQLLHIPQPLIKGQVQKVFLNICQHSQTRLYALRMLMSLLRAPNASPQPPGSRSGSDSLPQPSGADGVASVSLSDALEQASSAQASDGEPAAADPASSVTVSPMVVRRVLDLITWLARSQPTRVARMLLGLAVPLTATTPLSQTAIGGNVAPGSAVQVQDRKGKRKIDETDEKPWADRRLRSSMDRGAGPSSASSAPDAEPYALEVMLDLLSRPSCQKSSSQLEQVLHLLEVVLRAGNALLLEDSKAGKRGDADTSSAGAPAAAAASNPDVDAMQSALASLPRALMSQLPQLLRKRGLSNTCYKRAATVVSLLGQAMPAQQPVLLTELGGQVGSLISDASTELAALARRHAALAEQAGAEQRAGDAPHDAAPMALDGPPSAPGMPHPAGSVQITSAPLVLRLLQAICAICKMQAGESPDSKDSRARGADRTAAGAPATSPAPVDAAAVDSAGAVLGELAESLSPLWVSLGECIAAVERNIPKSRKGAGAARRSEAGDAAPERSSTSSLPAGAQQLLPLIESFFVLSDAQSTLRQLAEKSAGVPEGGDASGGAAGAAPAAIEPPATEPRASQPQGLLSAAEDQHIEQLDERSLPFLAFAEQHRHLLNALLQQTPALLEGSLSPLLRTPRLIEFENKRSYFQSQMRSSREDRHYGGTLRICVRRDHVFEDSFHQLRMRTADELRCKLSVQFQGEEGIDAGGVSREWYQVMAREIFNPGFSLFVNVPEGGTTFQPNPNSMVQNDEARGTNHLDYFKFVGRVIGKALHDGMLIDAYFTRSFYKHMLGLGITYEDIEAVDPEYYRTLKWILENDITDVLDMHFTAELDYFGKKQVVELRPGGAAQKVTQANKRSYVSLVAKHVMTNAIREQIEAFLQGFWELAPKRLINIFNDHELELLISGLPDIDVDDLRSNTDYHGFTAASPVIQWFWEVVREMDGKSLALLLQFVTGTSKVPLEGFKALQGISGPQKFQVHKAYGPNNRLPSAHTCFNQLDLIEYENKEQLEDRLLTAIREGSEGFGFG